MALLPPEFDSEGFPTLCGWESELLGVRSTSSNLRRPRDLSSVSAVFACALHMHQPMLPQVGSSFTDGFVGNLELMLSKPFEGDNHNAPVFISCYSRIATFIADLVKEGTQPRIMLDYSGTLLWGLQQMGRGDVLEALRGVTVVSAPTGCDGPGSLSVVECVEWLGTFWGHAVAPSTPPADFQLHVLAWQHHFCGIFGPEALSRVRGFSLPEMALPSQPEALYSLILVLRDAGYDWVMLQVRPHKRRLCTQALSLRPMPSFRNILLKL